MLSILNKTALAVLTVFSVQQVGAIELSKGDQSGLLANLYNLKADYNMYLNKGLSENRGLLQMLKTVDANLRPYQGQEVQMTDRWADPIRQTRTSFKAEFAAEDSALDAIFGTLDSTVTQLNSQKNSNCGLIHARLANTRKEMYSTWTRRFMDSRALLIKLSKVISDTEGTSGRFLVTSTWLNDISAAAQASIISQTGYANEIQSLDAQLNAVIGDLRTCYGID